MLVTINKSKELQLLQEYFLKTTGGRNNSKLGKKRQSGGEKYLSFNHLFMHFSGDWWMPIILNVKFNCLIYHDCVAPQHNSILWHCCYTHLTLIQPIKHRNISILCFKWKSLSQFSISRCLPQPFSHLHLRTCFY